VTFARLSSNNPAALLAGKQLLDAYRIVATHERGHFAQAQRVLAMRGFPAAAGGA